MIADKKKIIVLGSGALTIGQAGEFDYSGTQAVIAIEEEGYEVVVVNPNIATVQTNQQKNRKVYLDPVNKESVEKIIEKEMPYAIVGGFGGQTALNCLVELDKSGVLKKYNVKSLGTKIDTLIVTEDRQQFSKMLEKIGINALPFKTYSDKTSILKDIGKFEFPLIVRSAFALGGLGSGFADNEEQLLALVDEALQINPQVIIEKSIAGWKELEYEVLRDLNDNTICICNLENLDPLGIHTGDSIVVAPAQTLNNEEVQLLRDVSIKVVKALNIIGECNVQFALDPKSLEYYVIEVNARLSRSSALASKATGYPIAYIAAKVVLGKSLIDLKNPITKTTSAFFEPSLDYIIIKFPKWDLAKFPNSNKKLGSKMKSVGEVMSIGRNFPEAFQKIGRMILDDELGFLTAPFLGASKDELEEELRSPTDKRIFAIFEALKRNYSVEHIYNLTKITHWFLFQIKKIQDTYSEINKFVLSHHQLSLQNSINSIDKDTLGTWKKLGCSDYQMSIIFADQYRAIEIGTILKKISERRVKFNLRPYIKKIDTTSSEFPTSSNYLYLSYNAFCDDVTPSMEESYLLLGSGPYRIGSSVEFDWCGVTASLFLKKNNLGSIVINCNPETVSTDFNVSTRLYFEEISREVLLEIYKFEKPKGLIPCFGGQVSNNLIPKLKNENLKILGHSLDAVEAAENRTQFSSILDEIEIKQPRWVSANNQKSVDTFIKNIGFPILIRPSFVLSGTAMKVAYNFDELNKFLETATLISNETPVILTEFLNDSREFEVDGVASEGRVVIQITSEHIENAGIHSGDATVALPVLSDNVEVLEKIKADTVKIAKRLKLNGPFNIQYIVKKDEVMIIECNARASRSFPFVSKVVGINLAELAMSKILKLDITNPLINEDLGARFAIKAAMFSFNRLDGVDPVQSVEMSSTGEVGCISDTREKAFMKAMESTGIRRPKSGIFICSRSSINGDSFKKTIPVLKKIELPIYSPESTAKNLKDFGLNIEVIALDTNTEKNILNLISERKVDLVISIPKAQNEIEDYDGGLIRKAAAASNCSLITNAQKALMFLNSIDALD